MDTTSVVTKPNKRKSPNEKLAELQARRSQLDWQIMMEQNRKKYEEKKIDDSRKFTTGRCILQIAESDPDVMAWLGIGLAGFLKRRRDRYACAPFFPPSSRPSDYDQATMEPPEGSRTARKLRFLREYLVGGYAIHAAGNDPQVREWVSWHLHRFFTATDDYRLRDRQSCAFLMPDDPDRLGTEPPPAPVASVAEPVELPDMPLTGTVKEAKGGSIMSRLRRRVGLKAGRSA